MSITSATHLTQPFSFFFHRSQPIMSPPTSLHDDSVSGEHVTVESTSWLAKVHPYFKDPGHVLVLKLDCLLLVWAFIAGLFKVFSITKWDCLTGN